MIIFEYLQTSFDGSTLVVFEAPGAVENTWYKPKSHTTMARFKQVKLVKSLIHTLSEVLDILQYFQTSCVNVRDPKVVIDSDYGYF